MKKSSLRKQNTNYVYLLSSTGVLKPLLVKKTRANHHHQNPSPPNTSNTCNVEAAAYVKCSDGPYFEAPQVKIWVDTAEIILYHVLAAASICRQHLAKKILIKRLTQELWREYNNTTNFSICAKSFTSADNKVHNHNY